MKIRLNFTRIILFVTIGLLCIANLACGMIGYRTMKIETEMLNFKFRYPSQWESSPLQTENDHVVLKMSFRSSYYLPLYFGVEISPIKQSEIIREQLNKIYAVSINPEHSIITVDDHKGDYVSYAQHVSDTDLDQEMQEVVFETRQFIWRIFLLQDSRISANEKKDFNVIIKSFKILN